MDPKDQKSWDYIIKHILPNGGIKTEYVIDKDDLDGYITEKYFDMEDDEEVTTQKQWDSVMESEEDGSWQSKPVIDRKAKQFEEFAKAAMHELAEHGLADFVLLKNDKLRAWWQQVLKEELAAQTKREAIERKKMLKEQALSKLSDEEKEALGLNKKGK
jgi:hypothetical protein